MSPLTISQDFKPTWTFRQTVEVPAAAVLGPLNPGDDRDAQFVVGDPVLAVEDIALQQCEEALHGGVIAS